ncbi:10948_t:CDS:2, partial [Gigaspora rosea]
NIPNRALKSNWWTIILLNAKPFVVLESARIPEEAKELPCLFKFLIGDYPGSELAKCETLEKQKWRHADAPMVVNKAKALVKYLPKLSPFLNSLTDYSVCQKHYNNIIVKNFVLEQLEKVGDSVFFIPMKKNKKKIELSNNELNFCDFEVQVSLPDPEYESLIKKINELERLNKQLLLENEILKKQLNNKYDNQQVRVEAAIEIAKRERNALYNDVVKLINDPSDKYSRIFIPEIFKKF